MKKFHSTDVPAERLFPTPHFYMWLSKTPKKMYKIQ